MTAPTSTTITTPTLLRSAETGGREPARRSEWEGGSRLLLEIEALVEAGIVLAVIVAMFILDNLPARPTELHEFLGLRITLKNAALLLAYAALWRVLSAAWGRSAAASRGMREQMLRSWGLCTAGSGFALLFPLMSSSGAFGYTTVLLFYLGTLLTVLPFRAAMYAIRRGVRTDATFRQLLIVGTGPRARRLHDQLCAGPDPRFHLVGFIDSGDMAAGPAVRQRILGTVEDLESLLFHQVVDEVLVALPVKSCYATIEQVIATCERVGVQASYPVDCFQCTVSSPRYEDVMDQGVVHMEMAPTDWRRVVKRLVDLVVASAGLVVIAPLLAVIGVAIKLTSRGPVLFRQRRYGYRRRPFIMYKFRTMRRDAEALQGGLESANEASGPVFKIRDDPRITRLGRLLRRSSLDELPQLFNVVRGDMALVGPRPMAFRDVHLFSEAWLLRRFSMPPGITGLWQVSGRSELGFDQWIQLDLHYIDHWSLRLDFRILARTLPAVICGRGAT